MSGDGQIQISFGVLWKVVGTIVLIVAAFVTLQVQVAGMSNAHRELKLEVEKEVETIKEDVEEQEEEYDGIAVQQMAIIKDIDQVQEKIGEVDKKQDSIYEVLVAIKDQKKKGFFRR